MADLIPGLSIPLNALNPTADLTSNFKALSDNLTNIQANPNVLSNNRLSSTVNVGQAGALNLQGNLDASTKKTAIIYAPVIASNSPNSTVSSAPNINQAGDALSPLNGLLQSPSLIIVGILALGAVFLLSSSAGHKTTSVNAEIGRGSKNVGEGANI